MKVKSGYLHFTFVNFVKIIDMKNFLLIAVLSFVIFSCGTGNSSITSSPSDGTTKNDTVRIANDSLEYEIIIVEPGFQSWLISQPPRGFYGQAKLEGKNRQFVAEYNSRVLQPNLYSRNLYGEQINYDPTIDYGYEVNYLLYNYFVYFQEKYNQKFIGGRN
ncbi:MAG: hypothetical protein CL528_05210 [Aequorivita sp.]|jgi:hypothetical protein|nr:hypothetical protein [Aequorivita sp.]MBP41151.1 hypothetical protein [Aequorivita sp.]HBC03429.1 hypothetical protein [Aequorivita sp.]|tara:strand:+ start:82747 stop:83229 length:483 start_codon:yes stop_codon:yes gene_type:complete